MIVSPPGAWLLRPLRVTQDSTAELKVSAPEGVRFAAGLPPGVLSASSLGGLPYAAFGDLRVETIRLQGVSLTVAIARAHRRQSEEELLDWIRASAAMIADYFGRFPADGALLLVAPAPGKQIHGRARGTGGGSILFLLGTQLEIAPAGGGWGVVYEVVPLGFSSVPPRDHWAEEGVRTYVGAEGACRAGGRR